MATAVSFYFVCLTIIIILLEQGKLSPVVGLELGLDEAPKSHVEVMEPSAGGAVGNIVVLPQRSSKSKL